jgi:hypothetical protein
MTCREAKSDDHSFMSLAEPLIIWPFCPDNMILAWFSGSFARCLLSAIGGHYHERIIGLPRREIHNPNSSMKSDRYSVTTTTPWIPSAPLRRIISLPPRVVFSTIVPDSVTAGMARGLWR